MAKLKIKNFIPRHKIMIKLKTLLESEQSLSYVGNIEGLSPVAQWKLVPVIKRLKEELETFHYIKNDCIKKHGEKQKDKDGKETGNYVVKAKEKEAYEAEMKELLDKEIELEIPDITYSELLGKNEDKTYPTAVLVDLDWLIKK